MTAKSPVLLQIRGLKKTFGSKTIHRGIDLDLHQGECLVLLGGSGTGKSLILRSIIGLETPDEGRVTFHGEDLISLKPGPDHWIHVRKRIGYVFQSGALFDSLTVYENLAYPLRAHSSLNEEQISEKVRQILELIDMKGAEELLPAELSGGMQKRAGLARTMILEPEILLLDEPTAGLDPANTRRFVANILEVKARGVTSIFVTHDIPSALALGDRIAVLDHGKIHSTLTPQQFVQSSDPVIQKFSAGFEKFGANPT
jgi:phospholipid/cholesterol/gamma-HCH transport system ATP-binding protein